MADTTRDSLLGVPPTSTNDAIQALKALHGERIVHLVALGESSPGGYTGSVEGAAGWIRDHQDHSMGVYWHPGTTPKTNPGKATKVEMTGSRYVWVDVDTPHGGDSDARRVDRAAIRERLTAAKPSFLIDSGNGYQAVWSLTREFAPQIIETVNRELIERLGGDPLCWNVDRLLRVPGTINYPGRAKRNRGYLPRESALDVFEGPRTLPEILGGCGMTGVEIADLSRRALAPPAPATPRPSTEEQALRWAAEGARVETMLYEVDADDRDAWFRVGAILQYEFGDAARAEWDSWASQSEKFNDRDQDRTWAGFERRDETCPTIRLGTLVTMAEAAGWVPTESPVEHSDAVASAIAAFAESPVAKPPAPPSRLQPLAEFVRSMESEAEWLLKGFLPARGLAQFFGPPGSGKTAVVLDMALAIASGLDWCGHKLKRHGSVIYIAGEGYRGLAKRVKAWSAKTGRELPSGFLISNSAAAFTDPGDLDRWLVEIDAACTPVGDAPAPALVVVDTMARNFGPGNENSAEDMAKFIAALGLIEARYRCCVLILHHPGNGDASRARGSSAMQGALDACYKVARTKDRVKVTTTKAKDWVEPEPLVGVLRGEVVGVDSDGDDITGVVFDHGGVSAFKDTPKPKLEAEPEQSDADVFCELLRERGGDVEPVSLSIPVACEALKWSERRVRAARTDAQRQDMIESTGEGRNTYWALEDNNLRRDQDN